jgi:hypothetical protein
MSGFFQNLLKDTAEGIFGSEYLRDYTHASKTFRTNAYQYSPKFKFLFHVYFDITQNNYSIDLPKGSNFGLAVKTVKLPSYQFDTHQMNQYNRKRIVQTKIKYDPVDITFHDDNGNLINSLWFNYYTYYYKDATQPLISTAGRSTENAQQRPSNSSVAPYWERDQYKPSITGSTDWGYIGETSYPSSTPLQANLGKTKEPFFKNITIFGFNQKNFIAYCLVNPIITRFNHDTYSYAESNGVMENQMSVDYETVKYFSGALDGNKPEDIVKGFGSIENYDRTQSPIAKPGSNATILGQGGLVDAAGGFIEDLSNGNVLGAIQKAGTAKNTFKNTNLSQVAKSEINTVLLNATQQALPGSARSNIYFPGFNTTPGPNAQAGQQQNGATNPPPVQRP